MVIKQLIIISSHGVDKSDISKQLKDCNISYDDIVVLDYHDKVVTVYYRTPSAKDVCADVCQGTFLEGQIH